ncbi:hypothetical protein MMC26_002437 [Xylographa opegraphella]|nr:hypothetical protein [Xylographa opegraphella]
MDPQQRGLLEYTYKALENAGMPLSRVSGTKTSVYTGSFSTDWQHLVFKDPEQCPPTAGLGCQPCLNANRISWFFNLTGNSANIDTACSSSLVALDLGSNLISLENLGMLSPDGQCYSFDHRGNGYSRGEGFGVLILKRLSDAIKDHDTIRAIIRNSGCNQDGYTPGLTQPNPLAQEALIRDTYSTAGLTMDPVRFLEAHGTGTPVGDPIESNAFGTAFRQSRTLQDPLWVGAVKANIGHLEGCSGIAGVIKTILILEKAIIPPNTNFEQTNPKIDTEFLHIQFPLKAIPWPTNGIRRASVNSFGNSGTNAHVILDDAFHYLHNHGLLGSHVTVERPPTQAHLTTPLLQVPSFDSHTHINGWNFEPARPKLLMFSTHDENGIKRQANELASYYQRVTISPERFPAYLNNLAHTLSNRRSSFPWTSFTIARSLEDLQKLSTLVSSAQKSILHPSIAFIFTGQGAQWAEMGYELMTYQVFAQSLHEAEEHLHDLGSLWRLREEIAKKEGCSNINEPDLSQPVTTAVQIALVDLLNSLNVHATAVVGHSSGEIAAAYSIGAISAKAALRIAYCRGKVAATLAKSSCKQGTMMSVGLSETQLQPFLEEMASQSKGCDLTVACINSPKNLTISGSTIHISTLQSILEREKIFCRRLLVDVAYHSPHMMSVVDDYRIMIQNIERGNNFQQASTMISSVTGRKVMAVELTSPEYWVSNMVSCVQFSEAVTHLLSRSVRRIRKKLDLSHRNEFCINMLIEIGPHCALQGPIRDILTNSQDAANISYTSLLVRKTSALDSLLTASGRIKGLGYPINLDKVNCSSVGNHPPLAPLPDLPGYPFDHSKSYWHESRISKTFRGQSQGKLDLLGKPVSDWNPLEAKWRNNLRISEMPWMEDHIINGSLVYPGAGMLVMAIEAANQMADATQSIAGFELKDVLFSRWLKIPQDSEGIETQLSLHLSQDSPSAVSAWSEFRLSAYENEKWHECCSGSVRVKYEATTDEVDMGKEDLEALKASCEIEATMTESCQQTLDAKMMYQHLAKDGSKYGSAFQRIVEVQFGEQNQAKARIELFKWPGAEHPQTHVIHPTTLDSIFHLSLVGFAKGGQKDIPTLIPTSLRKLWIKKTGLSYPQNDTVKACTWITRQDNRGAEFDHSAIDSSENSLLVQVQGLGLTSIARKEALDSFISSEDRHMCYHIEHRPDPELLGSSHGLTICEQFNHHHLESIDDYLSILAHKSPGLAILDVNADEGRITPESDGSSSSYDEFKDLDPASYSNPNGIGMSRTFIERVADSSMKYTQLSLEHVNIRSDPVERGYKAGSYDVIVATDILYASRHINSALPQLYKLLRPGGRLLVRERLHGSQQGMSLFSDQVRSQLGSTDFASQIINLGNSGNRSSLEHIQVIKKPDYNGFNKAKAKRIVVVVESRSAMQAHLSKRLTVLLSSVGMNTVEVVDLSQVSGLPQKEQTIFICLQEIDRPYLYNLSADDYSILQDFLVLAPDILWVTPNGGSVPGRPEYNIITGLARVLRNEYEDHRITTLAFDVQSKFSDNQLQSLLQVLEANHIDSNASTCDPEYVEMDGVLCIPRLIPAPILSKELYQRSLPKQSGTSLIHSAPPLTLSIEYPGLLDTLHFANDTIFPQPLVGDEVEIQTQAIGMNFKDCLTALGQVSNSNFGLECAGIVTRVGPECDIKPGTRIMMTGGNCFKTFARGKAACTWKIPAKMSFLEAAAIPAQFGTAWIALKNMARLQAGETILIHAGAGGTGQAAIQIAQFLGATVFATVGSYAKKRLLVDEYGISEDHIFYSRGTNFQGGVMRSTKGRGVDVVLNSLAGDKLIASWDCIGPFGRFIEIGKKDIMSNSDLPMLAFQKNASFIGFDTALWAEERPAQMQREFHDLLALFENDSLHTQRPLHVYNIAEVEKVFRLMQDGKVFGKIVLEVTPDAQVPTTLETTPSFTFDSNATYVIAGGLGGLGRSTARWMISRNAKNLILLSRSGARTEVARSFLEEVERCGVSVRAPACDVTNSEVMQEVFGRLTNELPPIKGCIQASVVARDGLFEKMSFEDWKSAADCKTTGTWNLHANLPRGMDFFILLSSTSGIAGLRGQSNYNAGNTYEDAFAQYRVALGEKAVALDLGAMTEDGILAENPSLLKRVLAYGALDGVNRQRYYGLLDYYCNPELPMLSRSDSQTIVGMGTGGGPGLDSIDLSRQPMLRPILQGKGKSASGSDGSGKDKIDFRQRLLDSASLVEAGQIVMQALIHKLSKSLPQMQSDVDVHQPLQAHGVDSLLAVELRNWIMKEFRANVAVFETQGGSTLSTLGMVVAERSELEHGAWSLQAE